ncbi:MAG TPA: imelysin family protein [Spongiibacteraceae bacterium]|nr:imelysin family protein [Spongiibacteraceae bacterium]
MPHPLRSALLCLALCIGAGSGWSQTAPAPSAVVAHYAALGHALFSDALQGARELEQATDALLAKPSAETLAAARDAWRAARIPYLQSEVLRFGNPVVDDWEGKVNAWPLDEGLIDYVSGDYHSELGNPAARANLIANPVLEISGTQLAADPITPELLAQFHELAGSEANVTSGYHAIEFLLWGQDLNGSGPGAGERPYTDFSVGPDCSGGNCQRRADYLRAAVTLLIDDLNWMAAQWAPGNPANYRAELLALPPEQALGRALFGMGSLSLGELAGERMKVALEANSTEDEQDCFSDNTHWSHYYDGLGIRNIYLSEYPDRRSSGTSGCCR